MADPIPTGKLNQGDRLAMDGGVPIRSHPLPAWPQFSEEEIAKAEAILRSEKVNYWTGTECRQFETEFAAYHGMKYGIALANGTLALELAMRVLRIGSEDEVIVTPRSYFASASCIAINGAVPVFADIDPDSQNVTAATIAPHITSRTKALLIVHLAGWPCDMPSIMELAREHGLRVIEDCAQALGARFNDRPVGSFGDIGAFSFCQDKIISTAGEGGMFVTDDYDLWQAAWSFKDHGKSWACVHAEVRDPGFRWLHESIGSNWRLTEIQGGIGRIQLRKLDGWVRQRRRNAARLKDGIVGLEALRVPEPSTREYHAYYKFYAFVKPDRLESGWSRDRILKALEAEGIPGLSGSCPEIYLEKAFSGRTYETLPVARELGETSIMFQVHPTLAETDIDDMARAVRKVLVVASAPV
jgi:dTDP-4-amino-4,6-dideoxygalactose transaminase